MKRTLTGLATLALIVAGCGQPAADTSSTSSSSTTSTSTSSTSTSTTIGASTTTTLPPTTTTLASPPTTGVSGNWADEPLIVASWGALGWWSGSGWVTSSTELPVTGGEDYQVVAVSSSGIIQGGPQTELCEPLMNLGVELSDPDRLGEWPGPFGVAISAPWTVQPHLFQTMGDTATYQGHARDLLQSHGMTVASPVITQLFRTDLEGDGVNEVLVVAEEMSGVFSPEPGDYSIAFMRKVVDGEVQTAILGASLHPDGGEDGDTPYSYSIGGVGDLNGDGKMEIVVSGKYYEGSWVEIWEYVNDDLGLVRQLQSGCGA
jgi:hypothetical protein